MKKKKEDVNWLRQHNKLVNISGLLLWLSILNVVALRFVDATNNISKILSVTLIVVLITLVVSLFILIRKIFKSKYEK